MSLVLLSLSAACDFIIRAGSTQSGLQSVDDVSGLQSVDDVDDVDEM